jgi:hypothetical protein
MYAYMPDLPVGKFNLVGLYNETDTVTLNFILRCISLYYTRQEARLAGNPWFIKMTNSRSELFPRTLARVHACK